MREDLKEKLRFRYTVGMLVITCGVLLFRVIHRGFPDGMFFYTTLMFCGSMLLNLEYHSKRGRARREQNAQIVLHVTPQPPPYEG